MVVDVIGFALIVGMLLCILAGALGIAFGGPDIFFGAIGVFVWLLLIERVHRILLFLKEEARKREDRQAYCDPDLDLPYAPPKEFRLRG